MNPPAPSERQKQEFFRRGKGHPVDWAAGCILERFHRNCYHAEIMEVVFLEEKPRKRLSLL
jgi:hypothetical protein